MLDIVIEARAAAISEAMAVKRILPFRQRRMVGPFIFMDHAGPISAVPANAAELDVLPHPHIGLSTVSYLFGGQVTHRDIRHLIITVPTVFLFSQIPASGCG